MESMQAQTQPHPGPWWCWEGGGKETLALAAKCVCCSHVHVLMCDAWQWVWMKPKVNERYFNTPIPLLASHVSVWIKYMNPNTPPLTLIYMHPPCFALQAQINKHTTDGLAASTRASSRLHAVSWQWKASHKMCSSVRVFWNACSERYRRPHDWSSSWLVTMETHFRVACPGGSARTHTCMHWAHNVHKAWNTMFYMQGSTN